jgi:hypothetical protein
MTRGTKNISKIALLLSLVLIFAMGANGVYAGSQDAVSHVDTGVVNIVISEYTLDSNGETVPWIDGIPVSPGTTVSKIPYFTATGNDCYIRAKVEVDGIKDEATPITNRDLYGISDKWINVGEYYYYKTPLKTNESVDFFHGFTVPTTWNDKVNPSNIGDWKFSMNVVVDAIQADNFLPDFESETPWGDVVIKDSIHKDGYDVNEFTANKDTNMSIIISDYDNIIVEPEDFFEGLKTMVPGDSLTDSVEIDSRYNSKLYFTTESLDDIDLLQNIKLLIVLTRDGEDKVIYDGVLDSKIDNMLLGEFKNGEKGKLSFSIYMPSELDNEYTLRDGTVKWTFRAKPINPRPQTGDESPLMLYAGMMLFSGLSIIILLIAPLFKRKKISSVNKL